MSVLIIETPIFTRRISSFFLPMDGYRVLQAYLVNKPEAGKVIPGSGGLRSSAGLPVDKESAAASGLYTIGTFYERLCLSVCLFQEWSKMI